MSENLFRIGGYYRTRSGEVVVLCVIGAHGQTEPGAGMAYANSADASRRGLGIAALADGKNVRRELDLLPGELHNVNGEWLPIEDSEMLALQTRPQHEPASVEEEPAKRRSILDIERKRPPLAYFSEAKRFDPFPGFSVTSDCAVESQPDGAFLGVRLDDPASLRAPKVL